MRIRCRPGAEELLARAEGVPGWLGRQSGVGREEEVAEVVAYVASSSEAVHIGCEAGP